MVEDVAPGHWFLGTFFNVGLRTARQAAGDWVCGPLERNRPPFAVANG